MHIYGWLHNGLLDGGEMKGWVTWRKDESMDIQMMDRWKAG